MALKRVANFALYVECTKETAAAFDMLLRVRARNRLEMGSEYLGRLIHWGRLLNSSDFSFLNGLLRILNWWSARGFSRCSCHVRVTDQYRESI